MLRIPGVSQIQRNHGMLEVHCSSKLSPDLKIVPDWVESVIASLPVTGTRLQEINNNTNIQISIMDCFTGLFTSHSGYSFLYGKKSDAMKS